MRVETILAFLFGLIFCGILAYAGLRTEPIPPQPFFFLRVLSALSAAGIAAVIPGFIHLKIAHRGVLSLRAGGALAVFVLIYLVNPPTVLSPVTEAKKAAMLANYSQGLHDDALRIAEEILEAETDDVEAWNIKGSVAFYRSDFTNAVAFFKKAVDGKPDSTIYKNNLAYALIERGFHTQGVEILLSIRDNREDWDFSIGRAYVYSADFVLASKHLEGVSSEYWHGAARVLEAAALVGLAAQAADASDKSSLIEKAKRKLRLGYAKDTAYWDKIFQGGRDKHLGYSEPLRILREAGLVETFVSG